MMITLFAELEVSPWYDDAIENNNTLGTFAKPSWVDAPISGGRCGGELKSCGGLETFPELRVFFDLFE